MGHLLHSFDSDKKMEWKKQRVADAKHRGDEDLPGPKKDGLAKKMDDTDTFSPILAVEADLARASKRSSVATHLKKSRSCGQSQRRSRKPRLRRLDDPLCLSALRRLRRRLKSLWTACSCRARCQTRGVAARKWRRPLKRPVLEWRFLR